MKTLSSVALVATLALAVAGANAQLGPGQSRSGMMGCVEQDVTCAAGPMRPGYGPGYGPGMMGNRGYGYGQGYGMRGGPGWGRGNVLDSLDLTSEQRDKVLALQENMRARSWDVMGRMRAEMFKLRALFRSEPVDAKAVDEQQKKVDELRRTIVTSQIEARNQIYALLTPEQREKLQAQGPWWMDEGDD